MKTTTLTPKPFKTEYLLRDVSIGQHWLVENKETRERAIVLCIKNPHNRLERAFLWMGMINISLPEFMESHYHFVKQIVL